MVGAVAHEQHDQRCGHHQRIMINAAIAVVGGGPVGLTAALALADAGRDVTLIAPIEPPPDQRTAALLVGSVALLERLGVCAELQAMAAPLRRIRIADGTRRLLRAPEVTFDAGEIGLPAFGYNVANADLVAALERAVAKRGVIRKNALADSAIVKGNVTIRLSTGQSVTAGLVVAADGRRSRMRDAAGIEVDTWSYDQAALVCNVRHTLPHRDTSTEFHTEHGPFTLVPLAGNRSSLVWVDRPQESSRRLALPDDAIAAEIEERSASILGAVVVEGSRQVFPLSGMTARRFAASRVAVVGEAAHLFPPIGAQGLNLGLRDVAALVDVVGEAPDPGDAGHLVAYDRARRAEVLSRTVAVNALNRTLLTDFLPVQALRGFGLFLLDRIPALRHAAMRQGLAG
ncbi:MAG TPA: UbiH/UbiF family hydroxylase [Bauldia sp.]